MPSGVPPQEASAPHPHRPIRSYVLRQGRLTSAQSQALERLAARYLVPEDGSVLDFPTLYGRVAPVVLEIGCGMGETTVQIAHENPDTDYLGIEVHSPGVGSLLLRAESAGLDNLRVLQHDAVEVVRERIAPATLSGVHIYFPDPWPKKRHHKRRLIQPAFVALLATRLRPGGYVHLATDWEEYAQQMLAVLSADPSLVNQAAGFAPRPAWRPLTKFERRGLALGHGVRDLLFTRRA